jgi:hypothetical protein
MLSREDVQRLADWLSKNSDCDFPAIQFLSNVSQEKLGKTQLTEHDVFEVQRSIERVLPSELRNEVTAKRDEAWKNVGAIESQLRYLQSLGTSPQPGITRAEASALISELANRVTPKQIAYLTYLGVRGAENMTKEQASERIEQLIESESLRQKREDWITDRLMLYPDLYKDEIEYMLNEELAELLHGYVRSRVVGATEKLTKQKIRDVIANLTSEDPNWWQAKGKREVFFERLTMIFPRCVDGRTPEKLVDQPEPKDFKTPARVTSTPKRSGCLTMICFILATIVLIWKALAR